MPGAGQIERGAGDRIEVFPRTTEDTRRDPEGSLLRFFQEPGSLAVDESIVDGAERPFIEPVLVGIQSHLAPEPLVAAHRTIHSPVQTELIGVDEVRLAVTRRTVQRTGRDGPVRTGLEAPVRLQIPRQESRDPGHRLAAARAGARQILESNPAGRVRETLAQRELRSRARVNDPRSDVALVEVIQRVVSRIQQVFRHIGEGGLGTG